jgi:polyhydroxybutyrate depolymerase
MIVSLILTAMLTNTPDQLNAGDHTRTLEIDKRKRTYLVHIPKSYDGSKPYPIVLSFHGGGSNAEQMMRFCGLNDKADQAGFIVVYPSGTGQLEKPFLTWNGGNCCGYAMQNKVDDVAFIKALLIDLEKVVQVDGKRIYSTGMSNGGILSYLLASELSDRIAAIAPVGGPMGTAECKPKRPVPVIHFHGDDDQFAPFKGGRGKKSIAQTDFFSVDHSINAWIKANGCKAEPIIEKIPDNARDGTTIVKKTYAGGKNGAEVVLVIVEGAGHTWPGREPTLKYLGKSTKNISANDWMWEFFQKHPQK